MGFPVLQLFSPCINDFQSKFTDITVLLPKLKRMELRLELPLTIRKQMYFPSVKPTEFQTINHP